MARKVVRVSDMSGTQIEEGKGAVVTVKYDDARRGSYQLDVTASEAERISAQGRKIARRGRPPKEA
jgi:hypothetical protein